MHIFKLQNIFGSDQQSTSFQEHIPFSRRSYSKFTKTMACFAFVLLSLAVIAIAVASPVPAKDAETTTQGNVTLVEVIEVAEVLVPLEVEDLSTTTAKAATKETEHQLAKRSILRGDNPSNDLLADLEGLQYESGLSSLAGRRIKFLPTWVG